MCFVLKDFNFLLVSEAIDGAALATTLMVFCVILWPFLQKFIHQKLYRCWVLHGGFERQKKFMDKVTRSHSRPHQS